MKNKGFTLIELLAVITIMGILMLVGVPSISRIIENARKDNYIDTAKKYVDSVEKLWVTGQLFCGDSDISSAAVEPGDYYILIDSSNYDLYTDLLEQGGKSSWGNRDVKGYVRVNVSLNPTTGKQELKYYIALSDKIHAIYDDHGNEVEADQLSRGDLVMSIDDDSLEEIEVFPFTNGNVTTCSDKSSGNSSGVGGAGGSSVFTIVSGNIDTIGSEVSIGDEHFFVIGRDGGNVKLFAKYNLSLSQSKQAAGVNALMFSATNYWSGGGSSYPRYIYNSSSNLYPYVANYKAYLVGLGATVNDARLINMSELSAIGCDKNTESCDGFAFAYSTDYWTGEASNYNSLYTVTDDGCLDGYCNFKGSRGIRPVIVVPSSQF